MRPPEKYQTIKQPLGSKLCGAAVAAMALGFDLPRVQSEGRGGEMCLSQTCWMAEYLARYDVLMGTFFESCTRAFPEDFEIPVDIVDQPAIFAVDSKTYIDAGHWVFWDGQMFRDPSPFAPNVVHRHYFDKRIIEFYPLIYFVDDTNEH